VNLLFFAATVSGALLRTELGYLRFAWTRRARWRNQVLLEAAVLLIALGLLAVVDARRLLLFVLLPHAFAAWGIVTMNLVQHDGAAGASRDNHSRSFVGGVINWITFNNGLHAAHHEDPSEHWSLLPALHALRIAPRTDPRLIEPSFHAYLVRTFVWPARRVRFDGAPVAIEEPGPDRAFYRPTPRAEAQCSESLLDDAPPDSSVAR
jgi:fatty acid desaturase